MVTKVAQNRAKRATKTPVQKPEIKRRKLFVLDTNVLMHDPACLFAFAEHDVVIISTVFDELDNHKKGHDEINQNVRETSRIIEDVTSVKTVTLKEGAPLIPFSGGMATGRLFLETEEIEGIEKIKKADDKILATVEYLVEKRKSEYDVVLVTKDRNMRIKARAKGIVVEDYLNDAIDIEDKDFMHSGAIELPTNFLDTCLKTSHVKEKDSSKYYEVFGRPVKDLSINQFVFVKGDNKFCAMVIEKNGATAVLKSVIDYSKTDVYGINARNREQNCALNLLMDPDIYLVTLTGTAGSGKTLMTLVAALSQAVESNFYGEIIMTRVTVSVGEDIGFLPGSEEDKMGPWMGALDDNLDVLASIGRKDGEEGERLVKKFGKDKPSTLQTMKDVENRTAREQLKSHIKIKSMNFMRGRTFFEKFVIIDEVQNLTPKQVKMLITRSGPRTKIVCLGNLAQIDTPYLTAGSSGLTHLVKGFKGWEHSGHVNLQGGERSLLANRANEVL